MLVLCFHLLAKELVTLMTFNTIVTSDKLLLLMSKLDVQRAEVGPGNSVCALGLSAILVIRKDNFSHTEVAFPMSQLANQRPNIPVPSLKVYSLQRLF